MLKNNGHSLLGSLFFMVLLLFYKQAYGLYIDADISSVESGETFLSKSYVNDTKTTNLYSFSAYKIDKPGNDEVGEEISNGEIIFTPLKKILLPGEREFFKIFYRGKEDDQERYYKIIISETPFEVKNSGAQKKQPLFYPTISLETYLVVRPKNPNFKYDFRQNEGVLKNTGNTYFRVILHDNCESNEDDIPYVLYLLPQQAYRDARLKKKSHKYIVAFDKYYPIGNCD
ncbi:MULTISPECIES: fimbrial protein [Providencia]|uniref:Fimbrial protein n=1 Tax=Providencia stuartii TaxID=588 RepID=A0ABD5L6N1_PROST|nr:MULTISPECIES: fimbrial protein [Providencia]ELR5046096.1 fimbrial protein [Providencia rettgeri]ELR5292404.1 fimbrial protein [Providencia stuartii]MCR4181081.1 fimbrial protein [Providencia vermicola]URE79580.1 fimbrial protein [Providencia stuartii]